MEFARGAEVTGCTGTMRRTFTFAFEWVVEPLDEADLPWRLGSVGRKDRTQTSLRKLAFLPPYSRYRDNLNLV